MPLTALDTFTGTAGAAVTSRASDVGGTPAKRTYYGTGDFLLTVEGAAYHASASGTGITVFGAAESSPVAASAGRIAFATIPTSGYAGVTARTSTTENGRYFVALWYEPALSNWRLYDFRSTGAVLLGEWAATYSPGDAVEVELHVGGGKALATINGIGRLYGTVTAQATGTGGIIANGLSSATTGPRFDTFSGRTAAYSVVTFAANGQTARAAVPQGYDPVAGADLVLYHHGAGELSDGPFGGDPLKLAVVDALSRAGHLIAACDARADNWGNAASAPDYDALLAECRARHNVRRVVVLSQSMGGLSGLQQVARMVAAGDAPAAWAGIYPVASLANLYDAGTFAAAIRTAHGIAPDGSDYAAKTAGRDPMLFDPAALGTVPLRAWASPADTVVAKAANADALATRFATTNRAVPVVACLGDHGHPSHFRPQDAAGFFAAALGTGATLAAPGSRFRFRAPAGLPSALAALADAPAATKDSYKAVVDADKIEAIKSRTDLITAQAIQIVRDPASDPELKRGDSYDAGSGQTITLLRLAGNSWPADLAPWALKFRVWPTDADVSVSVIDVEAVATLPTGEQTLRVDLTAAQTSLLVPDATYEYEVEARLDGRVNTLRGGRVRVIADAPQSP